MFWITLLRAAIALAIGITLVISPEFARPKIAHFMGIYWLLLGFANFRAIHKGLEPGRWLTTAGVLGGVGTGLAVFLHSFVGGDETSLLTRLMGLVILMTGIVHFFGGFRNYQGPLPHWRPGQALGVIEIVLGSVLMLSPFSEPAYWIASIWAFAAGVFLLTDALGRRASKRSASAQRPANRR